MVRIIGNENIQNAILNNANELISLVNFIKSTNDEKAKVETQNEIYRKVRRLQGVVEGWR